MTAKQARPVDDPKALVPFGWAPGDYYCAKCSDCGEPHHGSDKRSARCQDCAEALRDAPAPMTHPLTPREKVADRDVEALQVERLDQLSAWETYVDDQPKRDKAHQKVRWAVESGKLVPPEVCEKCGKNAGRGKDGRRLLQGHHEDYDKPLDVVWLCIICHRSVTPYNPRRGTRANAARLFEEDAIFIRTSRRNNRELAAMFGVDFTAIQQLKVGKTWAHVPSYEALLAENAALRAACSKSNDEISQALGKALGYPWFKDDQINFPGATAENGVCVGDHVAESLADEAARRLTEAERKLAEAVGHVSWMRVFFPTVWDVTEERLSEIDAFLSKEAERVPPAPGAEDE